MAHEINLVPDVKGEMIRALKLRNLIFFLCIVISAASAGVAAIFGTIAGGQGIVIDGKQGTIDLMSKKLNSYTDLNEFLTIKDQISNINTLTNNKKVMSRTYSILSAIIPSNGPDTITISELQVDLSGAVPTFYFDARADAGKEPFIDYNVLESFKKSMDRLTFDYGDYVDKEGNVIPAYCIIEYGDDGAMFKDDEDKYYAFWAINRDGCDTTKRSSSGSSNASSEEGENTTKTSTKQTTYKTERYGDEDVVRIWRTPLYDEWYKEKQVEGQPYISLETGAISGVPHFESKCIIRTGVKKDNNSKPKWTDNSDSCPLIQGGSAEGINIISSANGRADDSLVLTFTAMISINPQAFAFNTHHVRAIPPSGYHNVTDSYVQIQSMFGERAKECTEDDTACQDNKNLNGEENG